MEDFAKIIQLRNEGYTQEEISKRLLLSRKSIGKYLRRGKIPVYKRNKKTKQDPFHGYIERVEELLRKNPKMESKELYVYLQEEGYTGSYRTISRKTQEIRMQNKKRPLYFERVKVPGEIMEGDFTTLEGISIAGEKQTIKLWVVALPYSNGIFATPYYKETFECFAEGSVLAFEEFQGLAKYYRLDNLSPVVAKISKGDREVTSRFSSFQNYYNL